MNRISTYDFRDNLAYFLDNVVKTGRPLVVEKYNKAVAVVVPYDDKYAVSGVATDYFGFMKGGESGSDLVKRVRRNKNEKVYAEKLMSK